MYSYIKGQLAEIEEDKIVVETGGIGYNIYTTGQTFQYLPPVGEDVKVYTYLHLREDIMMLYGFLSKDELKVFKLLLGVNGIRHKTACNCMFHLLLAEIPLRTDENQHIASRPIFAHKSFPFNVAVAIGYELVAIEWSIEHTTDWCHLVELWQRSL